MNPEFDSAVRLLGQLGRAAYPVYLQRFQLRLVRRGFVRALPLDKTERPVVSNDAKLPIGPIPFGPRSKIRGAETQRQVPVAGIELWLFQKVGFQRITRGALTFFRRFRL